MSVKKRYRDHEEERGYAKMYSGKKEWMENAKLNIDRHSAGSPYETKLGKRYFRKFLPYDSAFEMSM
jgi:hypothetical protein